MEPPSTQTEKGEGIIIQSDSLYHLRVLDSYFAALIYSVFRKIVFLGVRLLTVLYLYGSLVIHVR